MAQLQKGFEFDSSNPAKNIVTDDNLNALVANATLLNGAITEQTANSITEDTDIMLLSKAGGLIKQTKAQFTDTINSNIANINTVNAALVDADDVDTVDATLTGNLAVGGNSAMTGNLAVAGTLTSNGTANFTGTLQVNGAVGYVLTEIVEETIPINSLVQGANNTLQTLWTSASYTKPAGEIWFIEVAGHFTYNTYTWYVIRLKESASSLIVDGETGVDHSGGSAQRLQKIRFQYPYSASSTFTSTFVLEFSLWGGGYTGGFGYSNLSQILTGYLSAVDFPVNKFRIYKYKTA